MSGFIRFDDSFLRAVRDAVDLPALIGRDIDLRPAGSSGFKACCPFHGENTPSFFVKRTGFYRCFGCSKTGDAIEWMRERHGMSFQEAAIHLAHTQGITLPPAPDLPEEARKQLQQHARLRHVLEEAGRIFQRGLERSPAARRYLAAERELDAGSVAKFELGVVASGVTHLLSRHPRQRVLDAGLAFAGDAGEFGDRFTHRIMFPIRNQQGGLVSFAGRLYLPNDRREAKYLNGPETAIFRKSDELFGMHLAHRAIRIGRVAVLVEGYFDVVSLHRIGECRAVSPMGTALTPRQIERALQVADQLYFAYDGDAAGTRAAAAAARLVLEHMRDGQSAHFVTLPAGQDPDTFARTEGASGWQHALDKAKPLSELAVQHVRDGLDVHVVEMRVAAAQRARDLLQRVEKASMYRHSLRLALEAVVGIPLE